MEDRIIILSYKGHLTFSTIGRLLTQLKYKVKEHGIKIGTYKRIISVMIEALENIYKYSDQYDGDPFIRRNHVPVFTLEKLNGFINIRVSNPVKNEDKADLKSKLDMVNGKNRDELKMLYRSTISDGKFTPKGGAGLGIIEMAKISGNPLQYDFVPINDSYSQYSLTISFNNH